MTKSKMKAIKWLLAIAVATSLAVYLLPSLLEMGGKLQHSLSDFNWAFLAVAFALAIISRPLNALGWRIVLSTFGYSLPWGSAVRIWITSEVCRWLPGNVWHVGSRTAQLTERGIPAIVGIASVALELLMMIAASFSVVIAGALFYASHWIEAKDRLAELFSTNAIGLLEIACGLAVLAAVAFFAARHWMPKKLSALRERFAALRQNPPRPLPTASCLVFYLIFVLLNGVAFYVTLKAVAPTNGIPLFAAIAVNAAAWMAALIPLGAPAGLGVREAILVLELSAWMDHGEALLIAILWRFLLLSAELFCVAAAYALPALKSIVDSPKRASLGEKPEIAGRAVPPPGQREPYPPDIADDYRLLRQFSPFHRESVEPSVSGAMKDEK